MEAGAELSLQPSQEEFGGKFHDRARMVVTERLRGLNKHRRDACERLTGPSKKAVMIAAVASVLFVTGCGSVKLPDIPGVFASSTPTATATSAPISRTEVRPTSISPTTAPTGTPETSFLTTVSRVGNLTFTFDRDGNPLSYKTPDGKKVVINQSKLAEVKQKALQKKESEIVDIINVPEEKQEVSPPPASREHPVLSELPADVLTKEQLKARGIEIIQASDTELSIRKGAFEPGGPLEDFSSGKNQMQIVLIDGPLVSPTYLDDSKYDSVRKILADFRDKEAGGPKEYQQERVKVLEEMISKMRQEVLVTENKGDMRTASFKRDILLDYKEMLFRYEHMTAEELLAEASISGARSAVGLYVSPRLETKGKAVVFVAVGKNLTSKNLVSIYFDKDGRVQFRAYSTSHGIPGNTPLAAQSFPDPDSFALNQSASRDNPKSYPYAGQTPGFALRHEIKHYQKIEAAARKKGDYKNYINSDGSIDADAFERIRREEIDARNEYDTDMEVMGDIRRGWERWKNSGYKDNSGNHFSFKVPGGYILTQRQVPIQYKDTPGVLV